MRKTNNLFILGDIYSTFEGFVPEDYDSWYSTVVKESTDVNHVSQTWWYQYIQETGANLILNCSYSGTTICNTGYDAEDCSHNSFVARLNLLIGQGFFKKNLVDTCIIFGGTNDSWADSPLGKLLYKEWDSKDLYSVLPAFCYLLYQTKKELPNARVIVIINSDLKLEISEGMKSACKHYGVKFVALENINKIEGHPSIAGMKQIKETILRETRR
jgi:hypothetical protein